MKTPQKFMHIAVKRDLHTQMKIAAARQNKSLAKYVESLHNGL